MAKHFYLVLANIHCRHGYFEVWHNPYIATAAAAVAVAVAVAAAHFPNPSWGRAAFTWGRATSYCGLAAGRKISIIIWVCPGSDLFQICCTIAIGVCVIKRDVPCNGPHYGIRVIHCVIIKIHFRIKREINGLI